MDEYTRRLARILWDYHNCAEDLPTRADFILATGSHDDRVAHHAADLMLSARAPLLVTSGGFGKVTNDLRAEPEGERFKRIAVECGVDASSVLVEPRAQNTGDNITLTHSLLLSHGMRPRSGIIVTKPYMKRRVFATAIRQWFGVKWYASAPPIDFDKYATTDVPEKRMIELMVGDLQRIKIYAEQGFQAPQHIPASVWSAYEELADLGFDKYVIRAIP
jgi:uncharacterized SAM-binding protein YcdF (DUF218 family)